MTTTILRTDENGLCTLTINRPEKLNALNNEFFRELRVHVDELNKNDVIGCVILRGSGKCFSAGHDLSDIAADGQDRETFNSEVITRLTNLPQIIVTAVHGYCFTGGLELALAGDIIIAAHSALFADNHGKWALTPLWGMSQRLPRRIGVAKAKEMMFTMRTYTGVEGAAMGLANMCVPDEEFEAQIEVMAKSILKTSWHSNRNNKKLLEFTDGMSLTDGLRYEIEHHVSAGLDSVDSLNVQVKNK